MTCFAIKFDTFNDQHDRTKIANMISSKYTVGTKINYAFHDIFTKNHNVV